LEQGYARRAFFWYAPGRSMFSRLSPLTRVAIGIFINLAAYFVPLSIDLVLVAVALILLHLAKVNWREMKFIFIGNIIMFVSMVSSYAVFGDPNTPTVIAQVWVIKITLENVLTGFTFFVRIAASVYGTLFILTVCTDADLLTTLRLIRIPHFISMIVAFTFRGIQTFFDDVMIVMEAQKSRGLDFSKLSLVEKFRRLAAIIIPLLILEFRRMEEISNAADARGYSAFGKKRTDYKLEEAKMKSLDYVISLVLIALLTVMVISAFLGLPIFGMLP